MIANSFDDFRTSDGALLFFKEEFNRQHGHDPDVVGQAGWFRYLCWPRYEHRRDLLRGRLQEMAAKGEANLIRGLGDWVPRAAIGQQPAP